MARGSSPGFQVVVSLADRFTRPIAGLNSKIGQTTSRLRAMATAPMRFAQAAGAQLAKFGGAVKNVGASFANLGRSVTGLFGPFLQLGALAGGIGLGAFVKDTIQAGTELVKLSQKTGLGIESLQKLQYAAKQENVSVEALSNSFTRFNRVLADAAKPAKKLTEQQNLLTKGLGYSMAEVRARTIDAEEAFYRLADAVARTTNPLDQARLAQAAYGKQGAEMLPVLKLGREGIIAHGKELEALGGIMTKEMAYASKVFGDQMTTIGAVLRGVGYEVVGVLLPAMNEAAKSIVAWFKVTENREWLSEKVVSGFKAFFEVGRALYHLIRDQIIPAVKQLKPAFDAVTGFLGPANTALLAFAAVFTPGLIGAILGVVKALGALALTPVGAVLVAVAAAGIAIYRNWEPLKGLWADVTKQYNRFTAAFSEGVDTGNWSTMEGFLNSIGDFIAKDFDKFKGELAMLGDQLLAFTPQPLIDLWNQLPAFFEKMWKDIVGWFDWAWSSIQPPSWANPANWFGGGKQPAPALSAEAVAPTPALAAETAAPTAAELRPRARSRGSFASTEWPQAPAAPAMTAAMPAMPQLAQMPGAGDAPRQLTEAGQVNAQAAGQQLDAAKQALDAARQSQAAAAQLANANVQVNVAFANAPEGMRATVGGTSGAVGVTLDTAYAGTRGAAAGAY